MIRNIHLTLYMGAVVPAPVSSDIINALVSVQVQNNTDSPGGFQLTFSFSSRSTLNTLLILMAELGPVIRVVLVTTVNGTPDVLIDGVIGDQQTTSDVQSGQMTLTLTGQDLTALMGLIDMTGIPYPAMPPEARVLIILAKYAAFGVIPVVIPSVMIDVPIPTDRIPSHQGTDLAYIKQLADEVGYVFYIEPGPAPGTSTAYWGPEVRIGAPQPALNMNMDALTNVESLTFRFDGSSATLPVVRIQNQQTRVTIPIPIPNVNPLSPPLGAIPPVPKRIETIQGTAKLSPIRAVLVGLAKAAKTADAVTANGSLNVVRYGRVLKARRLVGVRGAGQAFDGLYFVKSVTHQIERGTYQQSFTLARNGLISTVPTVPV